MSIRPNGAYKLLSLLMYGNYSFLEPLGEGALVIHSVRKLARIAGTQTSRANKWLIWLEDQGYIDHLVKLDGGRKVRVNVRQPPNIG